MICAVKGEKHFAWKCLLGKETFPYSFKGQGGSRLWKKCPKDHKKKHFLKVKCIKTSYVITPHVHKCKIYCMASRRSVCSTDCSVHVLLNSLLQHQFPSSVYFQNFVWNIFCAEHCMEWPFLLLYEGVCVYSSLLLFRTVAAEIFSVQLCFLWLHSCCLSWKLKISP